MSRTLRFALGIGLATALAALAQEGGTQKRPLFVSPDGRFGIRIEKTEDADGITMKRVDLVEAKSGAKLLELDTAGNQYASGIRLLWSPDSRRFALERVMHLVENRIEHEGEEGDPVKAC